MSLYSAADEEAIRLAAAVRDWRESALLDPGRASALERELKTGLRRTHWALRVVLFLFTAFVVLSAVGLIFVVGRLGDERSASALLVAAGIGVLVAADLLVARFQLYRFGVEEACAICSIALVALGSRSAPRAGG